MNDKENHKSPENNDESLPPLDQGEEIIFPQKDASPTQAPSRPSENIFSP
ncbi:MAG: hypothetical protein IH886_09975 [Nitrospinae bacterium]|nr:hypothetical protein [Nitrospinota bacterium]